MLLAHPFFWSDDRAMDFLTMLGNSYSQSSGQGFEEMDEKLNHAVHQAGSSPNAFRNTKP